MFVFPVPKEVTMKWRRRTSHLGRFTLWHNGRRATQLGGFTLWHNGRRATQLGRFSLWLMAAETFERWPHWKIQQTLEICTLYEDSANF